MHKINHYKQGYFLTSIGGYFNSLDIILEIERSEIQEIRNAIAEGILFLTPAKEITQERVLYVMKTALAEELKPAQPPRLPADYYPWAGFLNQRKHNRYDPSSEIMLAYGMGYYLGDLMSFLEYITFCAFLRQQTNHTFFEKQIQANQKKIQECAKMAQIFILANIKSIQQENISLLTDIFEKVQNWEKYTPEPTDESLFQTANWQKTTQMYQTLFQPLMNNDGVNNKK